MQLLELENADSTAVNITLDGKQAKITAGGNGQTGNLILKTADGKPLVNLGPGGNLWIGGNGTEGDIIMFPKGVGVVTSGLGTGILMPPSKATVHVYSQDEHGSGAIVLRNAEAKEIVRIDSIKAPSKDPDVFIPSAGGRIVVKTSAGKDSIILDGPNGDIVLKNADCAEEFDLAPSAGAEPGTVVVLDEEGRLQASRRPYDRKVAGVVSGAGDYRPGLVLDRQESRPGRLPVALMGKVYCKADAAYAAIEVGDLLTTSATPGHAMRADDPARAFGAVIGKALRSLRAGQGLIPVLVALR